MPTKINKIYILFLSIFLFLLASPCFADCPFEVCLPGMADNITLPEYIKYFFEFGVGLAGVLALISLAIGAIGLIISVENPEARSNAVSRIKNSILGLVLTLSSFILLITINPQLKTLQMPLALSKIQGLYFAKNSDLGESALYQSNDIQALKLKYTGITWPRTLDGVNNCNPNNQYAVFVIYAYNDVNFKNIKGFDRLRCGEKWNFNADVKSYQIIQETPGVYFYAGKDCSGMQNDQLPFYSTSSIPSWNPDVGAQSIRIVNGPDYVKGPFFGVIIFSSTDYKTKTYVKGSGVLGAVPYFRHIIYKDNYSLGKGQTDNYSRCINISSTNGLSAIIYKWVGYEDDRTTIASAGDGVTLYTNQDYKGGYAELPYISDSSNAIWQYPMNGILVTYPPEQIISDEEKTACSYFLNDEKHCLHSIKTNGNYLVFLSKEYDNYNSDNLIYGEAQAFSIGTSNLDGEFIGEKSANAGNFIEIIPLAEPL